MLFNSLVFIALVVITMSFYYLPRLYRYQVFILIVASLSFYAWHKPVLVLLLLSSAGINIVTSYQVAYGKLNQKRLVAIIGVASNLFVLAFYKYSGLFAVSFLKGGGFGDFLLSIPLPIGISFFTFQGISLLVDVFKENHFNNKDIIPKSLLKHAKQTLFYISFFPQLVAGPIVKAHDFLPQIVVKRFREIEWYRCYKEIVLGYFFKMVVADNLKDYTFWITYPYFESKDTLTLVTMLFGYSAQIFADFAGYSLIAIGIARLFGYKLRENFNFPYISSSFKEFWKRWHISLSSFLMEYLYFPLGGNRKGKYRTYINLMITMILGGLWHGAAWSYAIWGAFHGIALATERFFSDAIKIKPNRFLLIVKTFFVFLLVSLAWLLFKLPDFSHVVKYVLAISNNTSISVNIDLIIRIFIYSMPIAIYHMFYLLKRNQQGAFIKRYEFIFYGIMIFLIITNSGIPGDFIYFQF